MIEFYCWHQHITRIITMAEPKNPEKGTLDGGYWFARGGHALKTKFKPTITKLADDYFDA